jgi:hypothetical protein
MALPVLLDSWVSPEKLKREKFVARRILLNGALF